MKTLKVFGYSMGDSEVGISEGHFEIDLGLYPGDVNEKDREFIINTIIKSIHELHDNRDIRYEFSDEWDKIEPQEQWDYRNIFTYKDSKRIKENKNNGKRIYE